MQPERSIQALHILQTSFPPSQTAVHHTVIDTGSGTSGGSQGSWKIQAGCFQRRGGLPRRSARLISASLSPPLTSLSASALSATCIAPTSQLASEGVVLAALAASFQPANLSYTEGRPPIPPRGEEGILDCKLGGLQSCHMVSRNVDLIENPWREEV